MTLGNIYVRPFGPETLVNTYTGGLQNKPVLSPLDGDGFVSVWRGGNDGDGYGIYGQIFDGDGNKVGGEFLVNTWTETSQDTPAVTGLAGGGFVVTWFTSAWDDTYSLDIAAQIFDSAGGRIGDEFRVNPALVPNYDGSELIGAEERYPSLTALADGGFVIAYTMNKEWDPDANTSFGIGAYTNGVRAIIYDADGAERAGPVALNPAVPNDQTHPVLADLGDGRFVAAWNGHDGSNEGVFARIFSADTGAPLTEAFRVNTTTEYRQAWPDVAVLADGSFVVMWNSFRQDNPADYDYWNDIGWGVYGQRYDADGNPLGGEFLVNTEVNYNQFDVSVVPTADGGFFAAWESSPEKYNSYDIIGQYFAADGTKMDRRC